MRFAACVRLAAPAILASALVLMVRPVYAQDCTPFWDADLPTPGMNSPVNALLAIGGPALPKIVAAGRFTMAGGVSASKIALWNGTAWQPLGTGIGGVGPVVQALAPSAGTLGGTLFAGGQFSSAGGVPVSNVARWDGAGWSALGAGVDGPVFSLALFHDGGGPALYVGGSFTKAGGVTAANIARWDGAQWSAVGGANGRVLAMTVYDDGNGPALYVAGEFTMLGAAAALRIGRWDGSSWSTVGGGFNGPVFTLGVYEDDLGPGGTSLYAGGSFTQDGEAALNRIARWDGIRWSPLAGGTNDTVRTLAVFDDGSGAALYVGGNFTQAGGQPANRVARWDGVTWLPLGAGLNDAVFALVGVQGVSDVGPALYAGGSFTSAGNIAADFLARWVGCASLPGDMNDDGRLDLTDLSGLTGCLSGPSGGVTQFCSNADADRDADVDLFDVSRYTALFTGP